MVQHPVGVSNHQELLDESLGMAGLRSSKRTETNWSYADDLPEIRGNPVLIREALSNFVSNSLEAVEEGGQINVDVAREGDFVAVRISDDGVGIPSDEIDHLFEPFEGSTRPGGTGLGLPIAREIMRAHGGDVRLAKSDATGATFRLDLPLEKKGSE